MSFWKELEALEKEIQSLETENKPSKKKKTKPPIPKQKTSHSSHGEKKHHSARKSSHYHSSDEIQNTSNAHRQSTDTQLSHALSQLTDDVENIKRASKQRDRSAKQSLPVPSPPRNTEVTRNLSNNHLSPEHGHVHFEEENSTPNEALQRMSSQITSLRNALNNQPQNNSVNTVELSQQLKRLEAEIDRLANNEASSHQQAQAIIHENESNHGVTDNKSEKLQQNHSNSGAQQLQTDSENVAKKALEAKLEESQKANKAQAEQISKLIERMESMEKTINKQNDVHEKNVRPALNSSNLNHLPKDQYMHAEASPKHLNTRSKFEHINLNDSPLSSAAPAAQPFDYRSKFDLRHKQNIHNFTENVKQEIDQFPMTYSTEQVQNLVNQIESLEGMLKDSNDVLEKERSEYLTNMRETTHQLVTLKSEHEMYKNRLARTAEMMHLNDKNVASLQRQIKELEMEKQRSIQEYQYELNQRDNEIKKLGDNLKNCQLQFQQTKLYSSKIENDNRKLETYVADKEHLQHKYEELKQKYDDALQKLLKQEKIAASAEDSNNEYKVILVDCKQEIKELTQETNKLQNQLHEKQKEYHFETSKMRRDHQEAVEKLESELSYVKNCYHELKMKYTDVKTKLSEEVPRYKALRDNLENQKIAFTDQLKSLMENHYGALDQISKDSQGLDPTVALMESMRDSSRRMSNVVKAASRFKQVIKQHDDSHSNSKPGLSKTMSTFQALARKSANMQTTTDAPSNIWQPI